VRPDVRCVWASSLKRWPITEGARRMVDETPASIFGVSSILFLAARGE
jgi:hypothetical protein